MKQYADLPCKLRHVNKEIWLIYSWFVLKTVHISLTSVFPSTVTAQLNLGFL